MGLESIPPLAIIAVAIGAMGALPDILDRFIFRPLNGTKVRSMQPG